MRRGPLAEWEVDPRDVVIGDRLAVGGFAEVFIGKLYVSGHQALRPMLWSCPCAS
jgi:hypothetical protein